MRKPTYNLGPLRGDIYKRWDTVKAFAAHLRREYKDDSITTMRVYHALLANACTPSLARRICEQLGRSLKNVTVKSKR